MPIKCESCKWETADIMPGENSSRCINPNIVHAVKSESVYLVVFVKLNAAREICDREGDGHFVYFEPKTPTAGAAFAGESRAEFERDRTGQTGENNAAAMKAAA